MPMPTCEPRPDGALVIEAATAEEALAEVGARLGSDAEIIAAEKVHRGGWRGFFASELVQLTARRRTDERGAPRVSPVETTTVATVARAGEETAGGGLDAALARMIAQEHEPEVAFRDVLVRELALAGDLAAPAPSPAPAPPPAPDAPPAPGEVAADTPAPRQAPPAVPARAGIGVAWELDRLRELRLPTSILAACEGLDPADDAAWTLAIAAAVSSWCRPLPAKDCVLIGPRAHRLAEGLGLDAAQPGELVAGDRSVALRVTDSAAARDAVAEIRRGRWLHLVAGGARWEGLLLEDVTAVSWVGDDALPAALEAASRLGLVLGYGISSPTGRRPVRATAMDVAITIRSLVPRHA